MRPSRVVISALCATLIPVALALAAPSSAALALQKDPIELRNPYFDWVDVIEDGATYEWSVDVTNNTSSAVRLQIILDLLDDDDRPINRDEQNNPYDAVIITVEAGQTVAVEQQGVIAYDKAAQVVTYRHRHRVIQ
ncbi:MAG: hypothetical protein PVJ49_17405 [Acidobacteriota bacterium]